GRLWRERVVLYERRSFPRRHTTGHRRSLVSRNSGRRRTARSPGPPNFIGPRTDRQYAGNLCHTDQIGSSSLVKSHSRRAHQAVGLIQVNNSVDGQSACKEKLTCSKQSKIRVKSTKPNADPITQRDPDS